MKHMHSAATCSLIGIALLLSVAASTYAQRPVTGPPPIDKRENKARTRQQDEAGRAWQLRNFGNPAVAKDKRKIEALMAQTEEDFNTMLKLHNELARALAASKPIDFQFVSEATGEIRKRASSIQTNINLSLPAEENKTVELPATTNQSEMKDGLVKLCKHIRSFVTNPVIDNPNVIDAEKLAIAKLDLETVIQLSAHLKQEADSLGKVQK